LKRTNLLTAAAASLLLAASSAAAQTAGDVTNARQQSSRQTPQPSQPPTPPSQTTSTQADEEFELNIDTRRINENDFHAETAVEADGARGLSLRVGVALRATDIEVLLQGVRGHVRFRASLAPVLRLLDARRAPPPAGVAPTPP
jgi:hemolysin activation/secretion protein